mmetsp:Transcript_16896/g.34202  ORF Transcript_16896/g.34202 Transcript_16896/m.34202 type:complete len:310 (-) Transcript_16896:368-1297(-)
MHCKMHLDPAALPGTPKCDAGQRTFGWTFSHDVNCFIGSQRHAIKMVEHHSADLCSIATAIRPLFGCYHFTHGTGCVLFRLDLNAKLNLEDLLDDRDAGKNLPGEQANVRGVQSNVEILSKLVSLLHGWDEGSSSSPEDDDARSGEEVRPWEELARSHPRVHWPFDSDADTKSQQQGRELEVPVAEVALGKLLALGHKSLDLGVRGGEGLEGGNVRLKVRFRGSVSLLQFGLQLRNGSGLSRLELGGQGLQGVDLIPNRPRTTNLPSEEASVQSRGVQTKHHDRVDEGRESSLEGSELATFGESGSRDR